MLPLIVNHLWQSTLFAGAIAVLAWLLRNNGAHVRYWLWFAASLKFLLPFSLLAALAARLAPGGPPGGTVIEWYVGLERFIEPLPETSAEGGALAVALLSLWACGFAAVIALRGRQRAELRALLDRAVDGAALPVDATRRLPVKYTLAALEPSLVGVRRPVLLLPEGIGKRLEPAALDAIVAHELCHLRRRDNLTASVHMVVEALCWFHPYVWWIGARLVEERERACDEAVVRAGHPPGAYAAGLLDVCELSLARSFAGAAGVSGADLNRRIVAIMRSDTMVALNPTKKLLLALSAAVALLLPLAAGLLGGGTGGAALAQADDLWLPIVKIAPVYPAEAAERRLEGHVIVEFTITEAGNVRDVFVVESSDPIFEAPAVEAAEKFKYQPRVADGRAVEIGGVRNVFTFVLEAPAR